MMRKIVCVCVCKCVCVCALSFPLFGEEGKQRKGALSFPSLVVLGREMGRESNERERLETRHR